MLMSLFIILVSVPMFLFWSVHVYLLLRKSKPDSGASTGFGVAMPGIARIRRFKIRSGTEFGAAAPAFSS
jgi:hypothetical protein